MTHLPRVNPSVETIFDWELRSAFTPRITCTTSGWTRAGQRTNNSKCAKTPKYLSAELASGASLLITMGCGDACPSVTGLEKGGIGPSKTPKASPLNVYVKYGMTFAHVFSLIRDHR
jgi:hypothetical protein